MPRAADSRPPPPLVLDGPVGTELHRRGVPTPLPRWSAGAAFDAPEVLASIHRDYAAAGATVHTANTFRTRGATGGMDWRRLTERTVEIARASVPPSHRVAGSLAPIADCYRPDLSPVDSFGAHAEFAAALAAAGCDVILCETFPHPGEALAAVRAATGTGIETWLALTPGPDGTLLDPGTLGTTAEEAASLGASVVLVNCASLSALPPFVASLAGLGIRFGVYANAGRPDDAMGWQATVPTGAAERYAEAALAWWAEGASVVGGCCGTGPEHVRAMVSAFKELA